MTDFVNRLLGQAGAPAVRPAVTSLFEPMPTVVGQPSLPMGEVTDEPPPETRTPTVEKQTVVHAAVHPQPGTPAPASRAPAVEPSVRVVAAQPVEVAPAVVPDDQPELSQDAGGKPTPEREAMPTRNPDPAAPAVVAAPPADGTRVVHVRSSQLVRPDPDPPRGHPVEPATRGQPPQLPARPPLPAVARREPAEPTVHISIGRVEVRAVPEAVAPKRAEPHRQAVLSLDDYLRGRAGGERR
jgi:hypothetical protein